MDFLMRYLIVLFVIFATKLNAQVIIFEGITESRPSLNECMYALERGNLLRDQDENKRTVIAYDGKVFFIRVGIKGMSCGYFKPTREKK